MTILRVVSAVTMRYLYVDSLFPPPANLVVLRALSSCPQRSHFRTLAAERKVHITDHDAVLNLVRLSTPSTYMTAKTSLHDLAVPINVPIRSRHDVNTPVALAHMPQLHPR